MDGLKGEIYMPLCATHRFFQCVCLCQGNLNTVALFKNAALGTVAAMKQEISTATDILVTSR